MNAIMVNSTECIHHWKIDASNYGVCQKCGAEIQFPTLAELNLNRETNYRRGKPTPTPVLIKPGRDTIQTTKGDHVEDPPRRRGRPPGSKTLAKVNFKDLPKELQETITAAPSKNGTRSRSHPRGVKEDKVKAVGGILSILSPYPLTVQRAILKFAIETLETANKRWSNDTARHPTSSEQGRS